MLVIEDYDDDLHADPIKLCFDENHNYGCSLNHTTVKDTTNMPSENQIPTVDLTRPCNHEVVQMPKPIVPKGGDVCYTIKQLAVKLVDIKKFPWYYKRYIQDYVEENDIKKELVVGNNQNISADICMKIKYDTSKGQWKVHEGNTNTVPPRKEIGLPKTMVKKSFNKIDFKSNKGLVGMTIIPIIKEEKVCSSSAPLEINKSEVVRDKVSNKNDTCQMKNALINKDSAEIIDSGNKIVLSNAVKSENKESTEDKREDPIIIDTNIKELVTEPIKLSDVESNEHKINLIPTPQKNTTSSLIDKDKLKDSSKLKFKVHTDVQKQKIYIQQERNQDCEVQPGELTSNNERKQLKKKNNSSVEKKSIPTVSDATHKNISSVSLVSERKVSVIDSTSQKFQDIKKFVEKATKIAPTDIFCTKKEASKCNKSKPLDMPLLTEEKDDKTDASARRRISLKDSIVFENDLNSNEFLNCKELKGNYTTLSTSQQTLQKNNLEPVKQTTNQNPSVDGKVPTALVPPPTPTHTIPVVSHINNVDSKPRIKYTPMTRDYNLQINASVASTDQNTYATSSQSLLHNPSIASSVETIAHNRNIIQLLNAPPMPPNSAGLIKHRLPVQQMPQFSVPSYQFNYTNPPGYSTPVNNSNISIDYRMYGNNGRNVNPNFYYPNMYSGYAPPPQPQTPQWQTKTSYNQKQSLLRTPNSSIMGWINGNTRKINNTAASASSNPTFSNSGDKRTVSVDTVRAYNIQISKPTDVRPVNNNITIQTATTNQEVIANKDVLSEFLNEPVVTSSRSTNKTLKRPYKKRTPSVNRPPSNLENSYESLSKRSRTAPLPVSSHVKGTRNIVTSTFFPPISHIQAYEKLNKAINTNDSKVKCDKRKMPTAPVDRSKKISIEEYKKRIGSADRADLYSPVGNTKDTTGLVLKYATKKLKDGKYNLDQDLGYSSDTTVKL